MAKSAPKMVKVSPETHKRLTSMAQYGETMDAVIQRITTRTKGLQDVVAGQSSICFIDGQEGRLLYRGYNVNDLATKSDYEETTYLLWKGKLPTTSELKAFSADLAQKRPLPKEVISILQTLPVNCDAMDALRVGVTALGIFDDPMYSNEEKSMSMASKIGTIAAAIHRLKHEQDVIGPRDDLSFASNLLYMLTGREPNESDANLMNVLLILHADHELNASTFTARIIASTLSDVYSAVAGAVGALKGPLHGGANEKVVEMTEEIGKPAKTEAYLEGKLANKQKVMGFGHRVYRTMDPRARILREMERNFVHSDKERDAFEILGRCEKIMMKEKNLYPNVDLYSGLALTHLGVPSYLFTPFFAVGRTPGWLAHVLEQYSDNRIIRPRAEYVGPSNLEYVPIDQRSTTAVAPRN